MQQQVIIQLTAVTVKRRQAEIDNRMSDIRKACIAMGVSVAITKMQLHTGDIEKPYVSCSDVEFLLADCIIVYYNLE